MVQARKRFGQHFLERTWVDKVVAAIAPQPGEVFLEIGPGRGQLTAARADLEKHLARLRRDGRDNLVDPGLLEKVLAESLACLHH